MRSEVAGPLAELNRLEQRLAAIETPGDAKNEVEWAKRMTDLAHALGLSLEEQNKIAEHRLRAQRRGGKLIRESGIGKGVKWVTLTHFDLDRNESKRWQGVADVDEEDFEDYITLTQENGEELTTAGLLKLKPPKPVPNPNTREYKPMPLLRFSQVDLDTATIVTLILRVLFPDAETALDVTYGSGAFWDGSQHVKVTAHDSNRWRAPEGPVDFTDLPYGTDSFDVVLFDPPHIPDASSTSLMAQRYGTYSAADLEETIRAGTAEVWRVSRLGIVVKVTDHSHSGLYVVESDWVRESVDGAMIYDVVHQVRSGALIDPKWNEQKSAYNNGSTFLMFRKDDPRHILR